MQLLNKGHICLVGAGPGDPDLITIKGLKAIQNADVILYDALINPRLLDHNPVAKKIFVGKRRGYAQKLKRKSTNYWFNSHLIRKKNCTAQKEVIL